MKNSTSMRAWWWPFLIFPLVILLVVLFFSWRSIETTVNANALQSLEKNDLTWAQVDTYDRGRELMLSGVAPSQAEKDRAMDIARDARGVRSVTWIGSVNQNPAENPSAHTDIDAPSSSLLISKQAGQMAIFGSAGTDIDVDLEMEIDSSNYVFDADLASVPSLNKLIAYLETVEQDLDIGIEDDLLTLQGVTDALGKRKLIERDIRLLFDGDVANEIGVELPLVSAQELVSDAQCLALFRELSLNESVLFESGKAVVLPRSYDLLDRYTRVALRCPDTKFEVAGHTDNTGNAEINLQISELRAQSVIAHMVNSGLSPDRFVASGFGDSKPIANNSTEDGRAKNRRVEFIILDKVNAG